MGQRDKQFREIPGIGIGAVARQISPTLPGTASSPMKVTCMSPQRMAARLAAISVVTLLTLAGCSGGGKGGGAAAPPPSGSTCVWDSSTWNNCTVGS